MNIITIIQARTGSSRLPGKVLLPILNRPLLLRMIDRVKNSKLENIIIATSKSPADDIIERLCDQEEIVVYRGSNEDLLDRHYKAALPYHPDAVVKIPSDCPLIDPNVINRVLKYYLDYHYIFDYVSNLHPGSYPDGNDVEIMSFKALSKAWDSASKSYEREHTTPYFWENPDIFQIGNITWETGMDYSMTHRFTIDYEEDYIFIKKVYEELYPANPMFSLEDILLLLKRKPEIFNINKKFAGINWYRYHLNELKTISKEQTRIAQHE